MVQAMGIPISLDIEIENDSPFGKLPELAGNLNLPETTPNGDDMRSVLGSGLVGVINLSLDDLARIDDTTINVVLTKEETGDNADTEVDYTDVLLARAGLTAVKAAVLIISAYDLDAADIRELMALSNSGMIDLQPGLMANLLVKYPNFLRLAPNGEGEAFLADAKAALQSVHGLLVSAHVSLVSESDPQEGDLFAFESEADEQEFENLLSGLGELMDSLDNNIPATIQNLRLPWVVTLESGETQYFSLDVDVLGNGSMIRNESSFWGQIDSSDIYGGRVSYWKITEIGGVRNIRLLLDYWGYKRLELTGVLTSDDTVLTGTCSFQINEGSGYEEKKNQFICRQSNWIL
jgi:hypothetical protein